MKIAKTLIFILFLSTSSSAQEAPPDTLADKLMSKASEVLENGDHQEALQIFQKIEAVGDNPPPMFAYFYGKTLVQYAADDEAWRKGRSLLVKFVADAGWESEHYTQALKLLLAAEARLDATDGHFTLEKRLPGIMEEVNTQMVLVEGGSFKMGCTSEQEKCSNDEKPVRNVRVGSFFIGKYELTQKLWESVMDENPSTFANCPQCPVETVSWDDVQVFLQRLNSGGGRYRLPSEAEWEYASRGGSLSKGYQYAGSDKWAEVAWYYENADNRTHLVGQRKPNELGLFDMSGNVREWVEDCWHDSYAGAPSDGSAWEEGDCGRRVIRSGSWYGKPSYVRSANRFWYSTYFRNNNLGFRLALTAGE